MMGPADRAALRSQAAPGVVILDSVPELPSYLAAADVVVSMFGYNIAVEILSSRSRAVVVPRTWRHGEHARPDRGFRKGEQLLRAEALAGRGLVDLLDPAEMTPESLAGRIREALERPRPDGKAPVDLGGVEAATCHLLALTEERR